MRLAGLAWHLAGIVHIFNDEEEQTTEYTGDCVSADDDHHHHSDLPTLPTSPDKTTPATAQAEPSHCDVDLRASDTGGAQQHRTTRAANSSSKRSAPEPEGTCGRPEILLSQY